MAKTKPNKQERQAKKEAKKPANGHTNTPSETPEQLYAAALSLLETSQPEDGLKKAQKLWLLVSNKSAAEALPALSLLGDISIELGDAEAAEGFFKKAVELDPEGRIAEAQGGGAEKFLWLAQLCEEGGAVSVEWFERGAQALRYEIEALEKGGLSGTTEDELLMLRVEKKRKLANALCGIVEVYMTDLSWEDDAEARCESLVTEAMTVEDETSPEVLQTLASVRLSQTRLQDAQSALRRSLSSWKNLEPEDGAVPDFPTRISLSRLLMEADMEEEAIEVLERLILEDDQSVEAWYLGGWCQNLQSEKLLAAASNGANGDTSEQSEIMMKGSRHWLLHSLKLYDLQDYEDDRLRDHSLELVETLNAVLGPSAHDDQDAEGGDEGWEEEEEEEEAWDGIEDEEMRG